MYLNDVEHIIYQMFLPDGRKATVDIWAGFDVTTEAMIHAHTTGEVVQIGWRRKEVSKAMRTNRRKRHSKR